MSRETLILLTASITAAVTAAILVYAFIIKPDRECLSRFTDYCVAVTVNQCTNAKTAVVPIMPTRCTTLPPDLCPTLPDACNINTSNPTEAVK